MTDPTTDILSSFSSAAAGLVAKAAPAIVSVHSHRARAAGFVWKPGLVVTADEALAEEGEISILLADGTTRPAKIVGRDHTTDIALLRFDATEITPARLSPGTPALGSLAIVVAAARGTPSAALGVVSLIGGRWRSLRGGDIDAVSYHI
jgi:S1-C subfamily serine protease